MFNQQLQQLNTRRQAEWDSDAQIDLTYRALELCTECGELGEQVKKLVRTKMGLVGNKTSREAIADEVGDVMICLSLLCAELNIDLEQATKAKFNKTSIKYNLTTMWE